LRSRGAEERRSGGAEERGSWGSWGAEGAGGAGEEEYNFP